MNINVTIELRALDSTDAVRVREWRNDYRVWRWCRQSELISDVDQLAWFERQSKDPTVKFYGVWLRVGTGSELVGVAGFTSICTLNRRAEFSLYIAPERQRQGLGKQALSVLLTHGFKNLGLEQIWGEVLHGNHAIKVFKDLGFKLDGKRRAFYFKDGQTWDAYLISILRSEWDERNRSPKPDPGDGKPDPEPDDPRDSDGQGEARGITRTNADSAELEDTGTDPGPGRGAPWREEAAGVSPG